MSQVFFDELGIPTPAYNLHVGSGSHGKQTGLMTERIEEVCQRELPDVVVVYGDTNSTLAGALAAVKLHIPVVHVEAGLRSYNRRMPEEINRVLTDHVASLLICPTQLAVDQLAKEGITDNVSLVGDVMYDAAIDFSRVAGEHVDPLGDLALTPHRYILLTCHRAENTDDPLRLSAIFSAVNRIARQTKVLFPVHPRVKSKVAAQTFHQNVQVVEPLSYLEMLLVEQNASLVLTDSGGMQKEAFFFGVPCVTMRDETEWAETVQVGANSLVEADADRIHESVVNRLNRPPLIPSAAPFYGHGCASSQTASLIQALGHGSIIRKAA